MIMLEKKLNAKKNISFSCNLTPKFIIELNLFSIKVN